MFVDFNYYTTVYGGTLLTESEFNKEAFKACNYITQATLLRVTDSTINLFPNEVITNIKKCACHLAEDYSYIEKIRSNSLESAAQGKSGIKSETSGQVSVSYSDSSTTQKMFFDPKFIDEYLKTTLMQYLGPINVNGVIYNLISKVLSDDNCCCCI